MGRPRKCVICNESIGADEVSVPYKNRYAHQRCFNVAMKTLQKNKKEKLNKNSSDKKKKAKPAVELKDGVTEEEYQEKKKYYTYLRKLIDGDLSAKIYAVSEDYIKRYGFTWESMYSTLVYLNEIKEKELIGDIVGIIKYYHDEAQDYYTSVRKVEENNKDKDISTMYKPNIVYINPKKRRVKQLDIESIGGGSNTCKDAQD